MTPPSTRLTALFWSAAPVIFVLFWAGGYSFAKLGLPHIEPMTMLALRYCLAVACLLPMIALYRPALPRKRAPWLAMIASGLLIQCVYFGLAYLAMKNGMNAGTTAIVMALQPGLVAALSPLVGEARGRRVMWLGLALGFAGVALAVFTPAAGVVSYTTALLALGALAGITTATLLEKAHGLRTDPVLGALVQYSLAAAVLTPIALMTETQTITWHPNLIISLAYLVLANSLISITLFVALIQRGDATRVSALLYLVPPLAVALAWLILGEPITARAIAGFSLCLLGVYIINRSKTPA